MQFFCFCMQHMAYGSCSTHNHGNSCLFAFLSCKPVKRKHMFCQERGSKHTWPGACNCVATLKCLRSGSDGAKKGLHQHTVERLFSQKTRKAACTRALACPPCRRSMKNGSATEQISLTPRPLLG